MLLLSWSLMAPKQGLQKIKHLENGMWMHNIYMSFPPLEAFQEIRIFAIVFLNSSSV